MNPPENSRNGRGSVDGLDSVRRLEAELRDQKTARETADRHVAEARVEAERIVAEARREGLLDAEKRRRIALEEADREAVDIIRLAREEAAELHERAEADRESAVREALERIVPGEGG